MSLGRSGCSITNRRSKETDENKSRHPGSRMWCLSVLVILASDNIYSGSLIRKAGDGHGRTDRNTRTDSTQHDQFRSRTTILDPLERPATSTDARTRTHERTPHATRPIQIPDHQSKCIERCRVLTQGERQATGKEARSTRRHAAPESITSSRDNTVGRRSRQVRSEPRLKRQRTVDRLLL